MPTRKSSNKPKPDPDLDRDTMRPEYDLSQATRGGTAKRVSEGSNVVVIDSDLHPLFPTSGAVNEALRHLASIAERAANLKAGKRSA